MGIGDPDDPYARIAWETDRLKDPSTGEIPQNMRKRELAFAKTLPVKQGSKSLSWQWRGPKNRGGRTRALAFDVRNSSILLAGGVTGGMWRSVDGGQSWLKATALNDLQSVSSIVQDTRPGKEDTWYYGTGENYGVVSGTSFSALLSGDGIFKSTDNGQSWTQLASTSVDRPQFYEINGSFKQVNRIVIDHTDTINDVVLAAVYNGITRSTDGGQTWNTVLGIDTTQNQQSEQSEIVITSDGVFYATIGDGASVEGLFRSTDGINWTRISSTPGALFPGNADRTVLALDPQNENKLYFLCQTSTASTGINGHIIGLYRYLSGDGTGANGSWELRTSSLPSGSCTGYFSFNFALMNTQGGYDMGIAVHPTDSNVVYIAGINVWRSSDAFQTPDSTKWIGGYKCNTSNPIDYLYDNHHPDVHRLLFQPDDPSIMWSGSDGGVHRTLNPTADSVFWEDMNDGYATSQFYTIHLEEGAVGDDRLIGGTQDNGTYLASSSNVGDDWHFVHRDDGAYAALPYEADFILTSSQSGRLYKKELDANNNEVGFERIDPMNATQAYNFINPFVLDPRDNNKLFWVNGGRIWRNNDLAGIPVTNNWFDAITTNWISLGASTLPGTQRISCLDVSYGRRSLYYGTTSGRLHRLDSLDGIMTRTDITEPAWPVGYMSCVAPNDNNADEWIITFSNYNIQSIWHTADGGQSWSHVGGNLEENVNGTGNGPACYWASIYPGGSSTGTPVYFVGTSIGLFSTELLDGDNTVWVQEGPSTIGNIPINSIATRLDDGTIAVATHGNGVYSSSLPSAPVSVAEQPTTNFIPAYPNPATDAVNIPIRLGHDADMGIQILDLNGRVVFSNDLGPYTQGMHTYTWPVRNGLGESVSNGTYVVSLFKNGEPYNTQRVVVNK